MSDKENMRHKESLNFLWNDEKPSICYTRQDHLNHSHNVIGEGGWFDAWKAYTCSRQHVMKIPLIK
jgi:hypothetical protein